ncbi:hypothetical protein [Vreelandella populi]|uniref:Uncharacterized protein n=1 Tax=Vreelandella populi TaxID=2498858 RepID=A0A3S0YKJ9_9GAMM|nr:hypothetical protein [Halomonas populi]RUR43418.1 hypothetical protein ELY37_17060 [Halomonas populi]
MITRTSLRLPDCRLIESLLEFAVITAGLVFLNIMYGTPPPFGAPRDIGSAAFFLGMIVLLATGSGVVLLLSAW